MYKLLDVRGGGGGGGGGGWGSAAPPPRFFLDNKTSASEVAVAISSCWFDPRTHFETSLVTVSFYGYGVTSRG